MPFVCEQYTPASAAALLAEIEVMLVAAGWTLHDNVSATVKVYKSNGELADRIYEYIWLSLAASTITCLPYGWWNNATHAGLMASQGSSTIVYSAGEKRIIGGTKDIFYIYKTATFTMFGHIPKRFDVKPLATLTAPAVAGANVVLAVDNIDMFAVNMAYQLFGSVGEGRYPVKVTAIGALAITVAVLPVNMATGAKMGAAPSMFGNGKDSGQLRLTNHWDNTGTGAATGILTADVMIPIASLDPNQRLGGSTIEATTGLYVLEPISFVETVDAPVGYIDAHIFKPPTAVNWSTFANVDLSNGAALDTGTATSGTNITLTCLGKVWGINAYANKIVVIIGATGAGQTRKIISNTADTLTVVQWDTNPDLTSQFGIYNEVYRVGGSVFAFHEVINT